MKPRYNTHIFFANDFRTFPYRIVFRRISKDNIAISQCSFFIEGHTYLFVFNISKNIF